MNFVIFIILFMGLVALNKGEKNYLPVEETIIESANIFSNDMEKLEILAKVREDRMLELKEKSIKYIIPWFNGVQDIIEDFYKDYNPKQLKLKNISVDTFQQNFLQMKNKLELEMEKWPEIKEMISKPTSIGYEPDIVITVQCKLIGDTSLLNFFNESEVWIKNIEKYLDKIKGGKFDENDEIEHLEKLGKNWKEIIRSPEKLERHLTSLMNDLTEKLTERYLGLTLRGRKDTQSQKEMIEHIAPVTKRADSTQFMLNQHQEYSDKAYHMAQKDIISVFRIIEAQRQNKTGEIEKEDSAPVQWKIEL